jgi:2-polyprenyl-3-methyl-5-hydroxy-6-metoxy-1,4-benzoquinol methylase
VKNQGLKEVFKKIRSICTFYVAKENPDFVKAIRLYELDVTLNLLPKDGRLLEIGAGTGWQARALESHGYNVSAIDLPSSSYRDSRIWPVTDYAGTKIPFEDNTFNIVFSSNALEHIPHIYEFQKEIHRVLKPDGLVIHILPSSSWRLWTNITCLLKNWMPPNSHGEHAGNSISEIYYFSRRWWSRLFLGTGWTIMNQKSNKLFYTGNLLMGSRLSLNMRSKLSRVLGGACNIFVLRKLSCDN